MSVFRCEVCNMFVYDEVRGDPWTHLPKGTLIDAIPDDWKCPICQAPRKNLKLLIEEEIGPSKKRYREYLQRHRNEEEVHEVPSAMSLIKARAEAAIRLSGICAVNKICDGDPDRLCQGQKYGEPIGLGGSGKGLSFQANVDALDKVKLKTRLISPNKEPDLSIEIFGKRLSLPVMTTALSGVKVSMGGSMTEGEFAKAVLQGAKDAGTIGLIGNTSDDGQELAGIEAVRSVGHGIPIFKPQNNERLIELFAMAEEAGASAVGVDLDGVGSVQWERAGKPVYRKSVDDLKELVGSTKLPFIAKGIMSVDDALDAVKAGANAIDVSNHGGRALDSTRGVAEVLPAIAKAVDGKVKITAGGGIRTGFDVMKVLALGADAALIGRDMIRAALGGHAHGVRLQFEYIMKGLRRAMILTSRNILEEIDSSVIDHGN